MLVLSRKSGERLVILTDPPVTLTLVDVDRGKIRIGIEAPQSVRVWRGEIWDQIQEDRRATTETVAAPAAAAGPGVPPAEAGPA